MEIFGVCMALICLLIALLLNYRSEQALNRKPDVNEDYGSAKTPNDCEYENDEFGHCCLCGAPMSEPWDVYDRFPSICANCSIVIKETDGIIPTPIVLSPGTLDMNSASTFGKRFKNKEIKMKMLYRLNCFFNKCFKRGVKDDRGYGYIHDAMRHPHHFSISSFGHAYDEVISNSNTFIKYRDIDEILYNHFKLKYENWICNNCGKKFSHLDKINVEKASIRDNHSLNDYEKFKEMYELEQKEFEIRGEPIFLIDKKYGKIKTYCEKCSHSKTLIKSKTVETILPLICFESINEFKKLL